MNIGLFTECHRYRLLLVVKWTGLCLTSSDTKFYIRVMSVILGSFIIFETFCSERFPLPLGAWDVLSYFIVALPKPSI